MEKFKLNPAFNVPLAVEIFRETWKGYPPCGRCGHHVAAHEGDGYLEDEEPSPYKDRPQGWCLVNAHESAEGPECECEGYIDPREQSEDLTSS